MSPSPGAFCFYLLRGLIDMFSTIDTSQFPVSFWDPFFFHSYLVHFFAFTICLSRQSMSFSRCHYSVSLQLCHCQLGLQSASQMSQVSPKSAIVPEESVEQTPTCWTKNCGPETKAFKIRTTIQEVGIIIMLN